MPDGEDPAVGTQVEAPPSPPHTSAGLYLVAPELVDSPFSELIFTTDVADQPEVERSEELAPEATPSLELVVRELTIPFAGGPGDSAPGASNSQASIELAGLIGDTMLSPAATADWMKNIRGIAQSVQEVGRFLEVRNRAPHVVLCSMIGVVDYHAF